MDTQSDLIVPLVSTTAGGISVLAVAKIVFNSWVNRYEKLQDLVRENDKAIAVLQSKVETMQKDLNGVASLARKAATTGCSGGHP